MDCLNLTKENSNPRSIKAERKQIKIRRRELYYLSLLVRLCPVLGKPPSSTNFTSYKYYVTNTFDSTKQALIKA